MSMCPKCRKPQKVVDSRSGPVGSSRTWEKAERLARPLMTEGLIPPILVARLRRCKNGHDEITVEVSLGVQGE